MLASCSEDGTAKVWVQNCDEPIYDFKEHKFTVNQIKWSPTGLGTDNPNLNPVLATASNDHTVKIWDIQTGKCLTTLDKHK